MMDEKQVEGDVVKWAKLRGVKTYKLAGPGDRGKPDRIFIHRARVVFVEFKAPGKKPSALQSKEIFDLHQQGCLAYWFDDQTAAIKTLNRILFPGT